MMQVVKFKYHKLREAGLSCPVKEISNTVKFIDVFSGREPRRTIFGKFTFNSMAILKREVYVLKHSCNWISFQPY
jgi:hypothetical protein